MDPHPPYGPHNPQPLSQMGKSLVWEGQVDWEGRVDEDDDRREMDIAGCGMPMQHIYRRLNVMPHQISDFCKQWNLAEFALFGSILRGDFRVDGEQPSDIDVLFTDGENARKNLILQVRMKFELEDLVQRSVDMVSKTALLTEPNVIRRQNILTSARIIYVQG
ncbi:nucleotidyltransferase family protein [Prochlorothrix hollandica]|nr:nucleotidyltransferase domain-containing protein [Prochlorothrix hollandica]